MRTVKICYPFEGTITAPQIIDKYWNAIANEELTEPSAEFAPQSVIEMLEALEWCGLITRELTRQV